MIFHNKFQKLEKNTSKSFGLAVSASSVFIILLNSIFTDNW